MLNTRALGIATIAGTLLQLAMVLTGHSNKAIAAMFGLMGVTISLVAGLLYAWQSRARSSRDLATGGMLAGGACALLGILVSYALGDVQALIIVVGTLGSAVSGALGGWLGKFAFRGARPVAG